jgi:hypothetical protein
MGLRTVAVATVALAAFAGAGLYGRAPSIARPASGTVLASCGTERWAVKTLTDPAASKVAYAKSKQKTVEALRHLKAPADLRPTTGRGLGTERSVYRVTALLMSMRREDDSDIHVVLADPKLGGSMIAEFPAAACMTGAAAKQRSAVEQARADLAAACGGEPGVRPVTLTGTATLTGVGFFDPIHGQAGVAPNGIELHPVLTFASSNCKRSPATPPRG